MTLLKEKIALIEQLMEIGLANSILKTSSSESTDKDEIALSNYKSLHCG